MTERSCVPPISKVERHIADRFFAILWCSVNTYSPRRGSKIRSFSSDDGDSNENVKKAIGLHSKKENNFARVSLFLYISLPSLYDYEVKMRNFSFYGGRKQATTNFPFSS